MKSKNIKLITGYYLVFMSYWLLEFLVFQKYFNSNLSRIFSHVYLYFIAMPLFAYVITKDNSIYIKKDVFLKFRTYVNILILQSGLSIGVLKLFSIIEKVDIEKVNNTIDVVDIFTLLLVAPIFEELFYRKIIINALDMEKIRAVFVSAFLFASAHIVSQGFKQMYYAMVLGVIWGYLAVEGVGVKKLFFFHSFSNLWGYILPIILPQYFPWIAKLFNVISGVIIPILALVIFGCFVDKKKIHKLQ